jgi:hypothetical protein
MTEQGTKILPWQSADFRLGHGVDLTALTTRDLSPMLDPQGELSDEGWVAEWSIGIVESSEELARTISAQVAGAGAHEGLAAGLAASFEDMLKINSYHATVAATCTVRGPKEHLRSVTLSPAALKAAKGRPEDFRRSYGTHYVSAATRGGLFIGLLEIHTRTQTEKQSLKLRVEAATRTGADGDKGKGGSGDKGSTGEAGELLQIALPDLSVEVPDDELPAGQRTSSKTGEKKGDGDKESGNPVTGGAGGPGIARAPDDLVVPLPAGPEGASGAGSFSLTAEHRLSDFGLSVRGFQMGGEMQTFSTIDGLVKAMEKFLATVRKDSVRILAHIHPVSELIPQLGDLATQSLIEARQREQLDLQVSTLLGWQRALVHVRNFVDLFPPAEVETARQALETVNASLVAHHAALEQIGQSAFRMPELPAVQLPHGFRVSSVAVLPDKDLQADMADAVQIFAEACAAVSTLGPRQQEVARALLDEVKPALESVLREAGAILDALVIPLFDSQIRLAGRREQLEAEAQRLHAMRNRLSALRPQMQALNLAAAATPPSEPLSVLPQTTIAGSPFGRLGLLLLADEGWWMGGLARQLLDLARQLRAVPRETPLSEIAAHLDLVRPEWEELRKAVETHAQRLATLNPALAGIR